MEVDEVERRGVLQACTLELGIGANVGGHESRCRDAEEILVNFSSSISFGPPRS